jgi:hypothetical protein
MSLLYRIAKHSGIGNIATQSSTGIMTVTKASAAQNRSAKQRCPPNRFRVAPFNYDYDTTPSRPPIAKKTRRRPQNYGYDSLPPVRQPPNRYHLKNRLPPVAVWLNRDPIQEYGGLNLYSYVQNNPVNRVDALGLWGVGVTAGASVEEGLVLQGAGATGSIGAGYFSGGADNTAFGSYGDLGVFASGGAFYRDPPWYGHNPADAPNYGQSPGALGLYGGVGAGFFGTNAKKPCDLNGPFKQWNLNTPIGSINYANSDGFWSFLSGTWILSITAGPGDFGSVSAYPTTTVTATPFSNLPSPMPNVPMPGTPGSSLPPFSVP